MRVGRSDCSIENDEYPGLNQAERQQLYSSLVLGQKLYCAARVVELPRRKGNRPEDCLRAGLYVTCGFDPRRSR